MGQRVISNDFFGAIFGAVVSGEVDVPGAITKTAVEAGFALTLVDPSEYKKALCTLTAAEIKAADQAVRDAALAAGDPGWDKRRHKCAARHAFTDFTKEGATKARTVTGRMVKRHGRVNFGVVPGASLVQGKHRLVAVDFDTQAEKDAFYAAWSSAAGHDVAGDKGPTVLSPGKVNDSGEWVHKNGGHHWFMLPEGVDLSGLPMQKLTGEGGWVAMFGTGFHVLVPPSVRAEGPYQLVGQLEMIPGWLLEFITAEGTRVTAHREEKQSRAKVAYENDPIDHWAATTSWAELLERDDWTMNGRLDACTCPEATRPGGDHSNDKSATAHQPGCTQGYDTSRGHGPLYVWTDNAPEWLQRYIADKGTRAITKLQYVAGRDHAGNQGDAMRALGLRRLVDDPHADLWAMAGGEPDAHPEKAVEHTLAPDLEAADRAEAERQANETRHDQAVHNAVSSAGFDEPDLFAHGPVEEFADYPVDQVAEDTSAAPPKSRVDYPEELRQIALAAAAAGLPEPLTHRIREEAEREWAREEYRRLKNRGTVEETRTKLRLSLDLLADVEEDDEEDLWRIAGLWMQDQTIMLSAKWKAGKTTMVTNVVRCLADGGKFLGQFDVEPVTGGRILIVNAEMTRRQFNRWLYDAGIKNRDRVLAFHVRDAGPSYGDILDPTRRDLLVEMIVENSVKVLILDPLNPLLSSSGVEENSSTDVAKWFNALADIKERTGVTEVMLVHHFGHSGERGRGSSKFMDAPDALWTYTMDEVQEDEQDEADEMLGPVRKPGAPRYISAVGREVDLAKSVVEFDPETRTLTIPSMGGMPMSAAAGRKERKQRKTEDAVNKVVKAVGDNPGLGWTRLHKEFIGGNLDDAKIARDRALSRGLIENRGDVDRMKLFPIGE
jgi:hypothetical protein